MGTETPIKGERNDSLEELRDNQRGLTTKALGEREGETYEACKTQGRQRRGVFITE